MKSTTAFAMCALTASATLLSPPALRLHAQTTTPWMDSTGVNVRELTTTGKSTYFILEPGYQLTLAEKGSGKKTQLVITVLPETQNIGGVDTRVVEERETVGGVPVEVSRNYFAIHPQTHDVFYFGEDVDIYKKGKIAGHDGAWHHGTNKARFGLMVPGSPAVGMRYYQEQAMGVARDRAQVISLTERISTPAGTFDHCLKTKETSPLELILHEFKIYAPGIGLVKDGSLELISHAYVPAFQE